MSEYFCEILRVNGSSKILFQAGVFHSVDVERDSTGRLSGYHKYTSASTVARRENEEIPDP